MLDALSSLAVISKVLNSKYTTTRLKITGMFPKFIIYNTKSFLLKGSKKHNIQIVLPLCHWLIIIALIFYNAFKVFRI